MARKSKQFVLVSGLPGSGKTTLAKKLSPLLSLPVIDKDDVLERLFETRGVGDSSWRRALSREADAIFQQEAEASNGAILVSFWRQAGMPMASGTPVDWLMRLSPCLVNLHCDCPAEVASSRFSMRRRHPGHLDDARPREELTASFRSLEQLRPLKIGIRVCVDTREEPETGDLASRISRAFEAAGQS